MATTPQRILVATDFSSTADRAQSVALSLAEWFDADLDFVHVRVLLDDPYLKEEHQLELERMLVASDRQRRQALEKSPSESGISINTHLIRGVSAAEAIVETSGNLGCDLIVMGTHGRRGFSHLLLGSVAENTVRTAPMPVLTVRPDVSLPPDGIRNILVPYDFSDNSAHAMRIAATWAEAFGAGITLFHAVEPVVYPEFYAVDLLPDEMIGRLKTRSKEALDLAAGKLVERAQVGTHVTVGRAGDAIVAETQAGRHDLVIMGTRGLSAIEHLLLGSVAENVLRRCSLPLLTVRQDS